MMSYQLDLFEPLPTELDLANARIDELEESMHKQRKRLFAQMNQLSKLCVKLDEEIRQLRTMMIERKK